MRGYSGVSIFIAFWSLSRKPDGCQVKFWHMIDPAPYGNVCFRESCIAAFVSTVSGSSGPLRAQTEECYANCGWQFLIVSAERQSARYRTDKKSWFLGQQIQMP